MAKFTSRKDPVIDLEVPVTEPELAGDTIEDEEPEAQRDPVGDIPIPTVAQKVSVEEDLVRVRARDDHRCNINGDPYDLQAGKVYNVPRYVKDILLRAGKLDPL